MLFLPGGEINGGFIGDSQSLAGSRKSLNMLHGQPVVMMPHPSATGGHPVGPGFPPPPPPFMQVCSFIILLGIPPLTILRYILCIQLFIINVLVREDLQLICRKCHHLHLLTYILSSAIDMVIIQEIIKMGMGVIEMKVRLLHTVINNNNTTMEIIRMDRVFKIFNYETVFNCIVYRVVNTYEKTYICAKL